MGWICKCVANGGDRRGGEFYREELRERERETKNSSAGANGAYPHLFGLRLAEKLFGRSLAEKASFGHRWAENGPVRPPATRSYYFRPGPRQQRVFGPTAAEKPTSATPWPKLPFRPTPGRRATSFAFFSFYAIVSEIATKNNIVLKKNSRG